MARGNRQDQVYLVEPNFRAVPFVELVTPVRFVSEGIIAAAGMFRRAVARLGAEFGRRRAALRTDGELRSPSDHTLRDIGLVRGGIPHAVRDIERGGGSFIGGGP